MMYHKSSALMDEPKQRSTFTLSETAHPPHKNLAMIKIVRWNEL
jgi:hypothetical protein